MPMRLFRCQNCSSVLFFENNHCLTCNHALGYIPELQTLTVLEATEDGLWRGRVGGSQPQALYRKCLHYQRDAACNWLVAADDPNELCQSCRLTRKLPDLSIPALRQQWSRLEAAKRRLCYGLTSLGLELRPKFQDPQVGVAFEFLADAPGLHIATGHDQGVITINCAEADDVVRERTKVDLHESYRTLLGHFRHEIGHYYWDVLIKDSPLIDQFRSRFGDERADYAAAQAHYYTNGPAPDWTSHSISAYATMHPWEDWAETWAHYLHMVDTVEIGGQFGITLASLHGGLPPSARVSMPKQTPDSLDGLLAAWFPLSYAVNSLNRGMGLPDWYPFTLASEAIEKLRFVHHLIAHTARGVPPPAPVMTPSDLSAAPR